MEETKDDQAATGRASATTDCSQCYLREDDSPADHDFEKYGAVCGRCYSTAKQVLVEQIATLKGVALDLSTDIKHWIAFAERQRRELPDVDHLPCGPTTSGINGSIGLLERVQVILKQVNKVL